MKTLQQFRQEFDKEKPILAIHEISLTLTVGLVLDSQIKMYIENEQNLTSEGVQWLNLMLLEREFRKSISSNYLIQKHRFVSNNG